MGPGDQKGGTGEGAPQMRSRAVAENPRPGVRGNRENRFPHRRAPLAAGQFDFGEFRHSREERGRPTRIFKVFVLRRRGGRGHLAEGRVTAEARRSRRDTEGSAGILPALEMPPVARGMGSAGFPTRRE